MVTLSIQFPNDEFEALCEHLKTAVITHTEQHLMLKKSLADDVMTKEEVDNVYHYLNKILIPDHRVVSALLSSCLKAKEQKILTEP